MSNICDLLMLPENASIPPPSPKGVVTAKSKESTGASQCHSPRGSAPKTERRDFERDAVLGTGNRGTGDDGGNAAMRMPRLSPSNS